LIGTGGCLGFLHPVDAPSGCTALKGLPQTARDHFHIFLINGMDPLNVANLTGLRDHLEEMGFKNTYFGQLFQTPWFTEAVRQIHRADPDARFVLIGFSLGSNMVRSLANAVKEDGVLIDLMVYLSSNTVLPFTLDRPENVTRLINIRTGSAPLDETPPAGIQDVNLPDVWHFGSPAHPQTLQLLAVELARLTSRQSAVPSTQY
jgi:hypothetical protein